MTDFTRTPNLGLYKPLYNAASGSWGDYLNANADVLDRVIGPDASAGPPSLTITRPVIVGGVLTLDLLAGAVFVASLNQNITSVALANAAPGRVTTCQLELTGDGVARTVDFGAWSVATGAPVPTSAAGRKDLYEIRTNGTTVIVWLTAQNVPL